MAQNLAQLNQEIVNRLLDLFEISQSPNSLYETSRFRPDTIVLIEDYVNQIADIDTRVLTLLEESSSAASLESRVIKVDVLEFSPINYSKALGDFRTRRGELLDMLRNLTGWTNSAVSASNSFTSYH
jgi:hypothetical protein